MIHTKDNAAALHGLHPSGRYFWQVGHQKDERWKPAEADELASMLAGPRPPMFRTIHACWQADQDDGNRHMGPLGIDLDADDHLDLDAIVEQFKLVLRKLRDEHQFNLEHARYYLTGGRGCHIEIPPECFIAEVPADGLELYPATLKNLVVDALFVDGCDLRIYSGKSGRMWRVPNVERPNGRYKVQVTADEALSLTAAQYGEFCSAPRPLFAAADPSLNASLALAWQRARESTTRRDRKRARVEAKAYREAVERHPLPSLDAILDGSKPCVQGWNQVALQLAIHATACGWSEEDLVRRAAGAIRAHESDGRYNTPAKRERELREKHRYAEGNPRYIPSAGGLAWLITDDSADDDSAETPEDLQTLKRALGKVGLAVAEINEDHAVTILEGAVCVLREDVSEFGGKKVHFMRKDAFLTLFANKFVEVEQTNAKGDTETVQKPIGPIWIAHPNRRTLRGVTFNPEGEAPEGFYNLWRGFNVEAANHAEPAEHCKLFLEHLRDNVCRGNAEHFGYLMAWFADLVQRPSTKPGVALVIRGRKGTGKSKVADMLRKILGEHAFKASKAEHIVGRFNKHLCDKLLIVAEESFFAGSRADIGTLKDLITSDSITIEVKHVNALEVRSCHRIMMVTNNEWAVPASEEERRFFVLDCGEDRMQDADYFAAIDDEMLKRGGIEAFLQVLQQFDLSAWNLRKVPQTDALKVQKRLSLESPERFILDCIDGAEIAGHAWEDHLGVLRSDVQAAYEEFCRGRHERPLSANRFGPKFTQATGAVVVQRSGHLDRRREYVLPSLEVARERFAQFLRVGVGDLGLTSDYEE